MLLIKNGYVIDPRSGRNGIYDILIKDNMIDAPKNNESKILELIPSSSIRIAVFQKDNAADIEIPKEIKTSSKLLL